MMELVDMQGLKPCPFRVLVQVQVQVACWLPFETVYVFYMDVFYYLLSAVCISVLT